MSALSFMRWAANYHLFILGALSFGSAYFGRTAARRHWRQWPRLHLTGMGASYIVMLTAFYVDNGKNLPLWRELPQIAFWFLPGAIAIPNPSGSFLAPAGSGFSGMKYRQASKFSLRHNRCWSAAGTPAPKSPLRSGSVVEKASVKGHAGFNASGIVSYQ